MKDLIQKMLQGDRRALSRLLTYVEGFDAQAFQLLEEIWPKTGKAISIGITGPAGAGKSTLLDQLIHHLRAQKKKVGVIAIDPSSPFTGGAVLGDRVRMHRHFNDQDVFIRSVGSRGKSGGVAFSTRALMQLFDAAGMDVLLVETVGAGQSEVDIGDLVDTTVVVLIPEAGDSVQSLKAGLLEIAHVFVVNKKDREGADRVAQDIEAMLSLTPSDKKWRPPIVLTSAVNGEGVEELWTQIEKHQAELKSKGLDAKEMERRRIHELKEVILARMAVEVNETLRNDEKLMRQLKEEKSPNPYALSEKIIKGTHD